jgi:predicted secreted hydrolase
LTDAETQTFVTDQRAMLEPVTPSTPQDGFAFDVRGWRLEGSGGNDRLSAGTGHYALDLTLRPGKPPVLHGGTGLLDVSSAGQNSYYYSRTRMTASGSITAGADTFDVSGTAWFDHQWGNFSALALGWDWFALQLDDGSEVMLYQIRDLGTADAFDYGTFVDPEGRATELAGDEFAVGSSSAWVSPSTGARYPSRWSVSVPSHGIDVEVQPLVEASEFDARLTTRNVYWEGLVRVTGTHPGWGFVELVGYGPTATPTPAPR